MQRDPSDEVTSTLQCGDVHAGWARCYRTPENEAFYDLVFDYLAAVFGCPGDAPVLDAGCGSSTKSIHLARRGYNVTAVDVSHTVLRAARQAVAERGLQDRVTHRWADITAMPFPDASFARVLCWGVLMHVPNVEDGIAELSRVTSPGGTIVISEANVRSVQAAGLRWLGHRRQCPELRRPPSGLELWDQTSAGRLVTRQTDIGWLIRAFERSGAQLVERRAGEFSELFTRFRSRWPRSAVHAFNALWFRHIRLPGPAFGNLLILRKL